MIGAVKLHPARGTPCWVGGSSLYQVWHIEILTAEPLRTTEPAQSGDGSMCSGGGHFCANDLDSCQSLASVGKEGRARGRKGHQEGRAVGGPPEAELCELG